MFLWACKHIPHLYDFIWNKLRKRNSTKNSARLRLAIPHMMEKIDEFKPDIIICTHHYASNLLSEMKNREMLPKGVITATIEHDFCLCPYWELSKGVDFIFQPYDFTTSDLIQKGFKHAQIKTFGLPIKQLFTSPAKTKSQLGLQDKFTVLLVGGGNGISNNFKLIKKIVKHNLDVQLIVINGKNKKTFNQIQSFIEKRGLSNILNLGFVTNIGDYYNACDVTISRCGSSVISETLAMGKPIIAREKMILNEKITKALLVENKVALPMNKLDDAVPLIKKLMSDKELYSLMQNNAKSLARVNASRDICQFLINEYEHKKT